MLKILRSLFFKKIKNPDTSPNQNAATVSNVVGSQVRIEQKLIRQNFLFCKISPPPTPNPNTVKKTSIRSRPLETTTESDSSSGINIQIGEAVKLIDERQLQLARNKLFELLGMVKGQDNLPKKELVRIYNNLGVCFNNPKEKGGDYDQAIKFFLLALEHDGSFAKAKVNLSAAYLNQNGIRNAKRAYDISKDLWDLNSKGLVQDISLPLKTTILFSTYYYKGIDAALKLIESDSRFISAADINDTILCQMASLYLEKGNFEKALELSEKAIKIDKNSFHAATFKGLTLVSLAQATAKHAYYQLVPQIDDFSKIESALEALKTAKSLFVDGCDEQLLQEVMLAIAACHLWLNRVNEDGFMQARNILKDELLAIEHKKLLSVLDFAALLKNKEYSAALRIFVTHKDFNGYSPQEKERVAVIFLLAGAPEQAEEIFKMLEVDERITKDSQFWLSRSASAILLDDKNMAIHYTEKARALARETQDLKRALSHYGAVMLRYADLGEVDRLMTGLFEYDAKFPEDKALQSIKALDEAGQLSQEMKDILQKQKKWFENIRTAFADQPIVSYTLEKVLKRPYVEVISTGMLNRDIGFVAQFNLCGEDFYQTLRNNFHRSRVLVFDYSALLNIAKMGLLGLLEKLDRRILISRKLYLKIQNELLMVENKELRSLWNYVRKSRKIEVEEFSDKAIDADQFKKLFDPWLVETLLLAKKEDAILVSDDLRLLEVAKIPGVQGSNTLVFLKKWKEEKNIDEKMYAESLGDYAERLYRFISYTGDDLFRIVMEDKGKITLRTYFLVNEVFSPGAETKSFTTVFLKFIFLIWKTGLTAEEKCDWLILFTKIFDRIVKRKRSFGLSKFSMGDLENILKDFAQIWGIAIKESSEEELAFIEPQIGKLILGEILSRSMSIMRGHFQRRISEFRARPVDRTPCDGEG